MTMQSVSLSALEASAANPRRKIDRKTIEGLAASIRTDGLLHNLVVSPVKGKGKSQRYQIVSGARRFHALKLLEDRRHTGLRGYDRAQCSRNFHHSDARRVSKRA